MRSILDYLYLYQRLVPSAAKVIDYNGLLDRFLAKSASFQDDEQRSEATLAMVKVLSSVDQHVISFEKTVRAILECGRHFVSKVLDGR